MFSCGKVQKPPLANILFSKEKNGQKTTFEWPKVVSEVNFPAFWGVIRSIKVVSVFRFGDRKCRFRDIAIRAFFRNHKND